MSAPSLRARRVSTGGMTSRECVLALAVISSIAACIAMFSWQHLQQAKRVEAAAQLQWQQLNQKLRQREQMRTALGLASVHQQVEEDVVKRVRQSLQDLGFAAQRMRGVRPREERRLQNGAAVRQSVAIELGNMTPADIGAWLLAWSAAENPWRITGMTWRHSSTDSSSSTSAAAGRSAVGNLYDLHISCAAVLIQ